MQRAIFFCGSLHGEEEEFLLPLCLGHEEFDIRNVVRDSCGHPDC